MYVCMHMHVQYANHTYGRHKSPRAAPIYNDQAIPLIPLHHNREHEGRVRCKIPEDATREIVGPTYVDPPASAYCLRVTAASLRGLAIGGVVAGTIGTCLQSALRKHKDYKQQMSHNAVEPELLPMGVGVALPVLSGFGMRILKRYTREDVYVYRHDDNEDLVYNAHDPRNPVSRHTGLILKHRSSSPLYKRYCSSCFPSGSTWSYTVVPRELCD